MTYFTFVRRLARTVSRGARRRRRDSQQVAAYICPHHRGQSGAGWARQLPRHGFPLWRAGRTHSYDLKQLTPHISSLPVSTPGRGQQCDGKALCATRQSIHVWTDHSRRPTPVSRLSPDFAQDPRHICDSNYVARGACQQLPGALQIACRNSTQKWSPARWRSKACRDALWLKSPTAQNRPRSGSCFRKSESDVPGWAAFSPQGKDGIVHTFITRCPARSSPLRNRA